MLWAAGAQRGWQGEAKKRGQRRGTFLPRPLCAVTIIQGQPFTSLDPAAPYALYASCILRYCLTFLTTWRALCLAMSSPLCPLSHLPLSSSFSSAICEQTTAINMLTGFLEPTNGSAVVEGLELSKEMQRIYKIMGVCPQVGGWVNQGEGGDGVRSSYCCVDHFVV